MLQRLDDRPHARAERTLDHDGIAGTDRGQNLRLESARLLCITAAAAGGKALPQGFHQRAAAEYEIDRISRHRLDQAAMQCAAARTEFQHIAEDGDAPAVRTDLRLA